MFFFDKLGISDFLDIKNRINTYEYVSFDIYDTLLKRTVDKPVDIFKILEHEIRIKDFFEMRSRAEKMARKTTSRADITIYDIYRYIRIVGNDYDVVFSDEILDSAMKMEILIEKRETYANVEIKKAFDWCIDEKKVVFISSDMYLPKDVIEDILNFNGIKGYARLYVSGTDNVSKQNGSMFDKIISDNKIKSRELIHVGDSFIPDYLRAILCGVAAVKIKKQR